MGEVVVGGLIGILGVILGWILSWIDRQGRIEICSPSVAFFSFGGTETITKLKEGGVKRDRTPGEISFMHISFTVMSFSSETKGLYQCKVKIPKQRAIKRANQTCISGEDETKRINKFNQIILTPGVEQNIKFTIGYNDDFIFPIGKLKCYLTYKSKLGIRRKIFIGKLDFKSPLDKCIEKL